MRDVVLGVAMLAATVAAMVALGRRPARQRLTPKTVHCSHCQQDVPIGSGVDATALITKHQQHCEAKIRMDEVLTRLERLEGKLDRVAIKLLLQTTDPDIIAREYSAQWHA